MDLGCGKDAVSIRVYHGEDLIYCFGLREGMDEFFHWR